MRVPLLLLLAAVLPGSLAADVIFKDTFNRADGRNPQASLTGVTDNTGSALAAGGLYTFPHLDPASLPPAYGVQDAVAANGGGVQILSNVLQLAVGAGTANAVINHNFTDASIPSAGGFSVSVDVGTYSQTTNGYGGGFALGMSAAQAASCGDSFDGAARMTGGFGTAIGAAVPTQVASDFWMVIRGDNSLVWGGRTGTVQGVSALGAKTGTITANFAVTDFNQGTVVSYEVFLNGVSKGKGTFAWSSMGQNYVGIDARDPGFVQFDNLAVATYAPPVTLSLASSPAIVASNQSAQPVSLSWVAAGLPPGTTYRVTADKAVSFPNGDASGPAAAGSHTTNAVVNGSLGSTTFTLDLLSASGTTLATSTTTVAQVPPSRPNVIVILTDDLGWSDLGCYGSEIPTPNIDALAADGMKFRQFYNTARCSPTRCSVMTGLYPQQAASDPSAALPDLRNDNNVTMAEMLKASGYRTYMSGKWHLGNGALLPENRGFQHVWRYANGQAHSADQWTQSAYSFISQNNEVAFRDYTGTGQTFYQTDAVGDYAVDFINHSVGKGDGAPFAMYMAFGSPHFPLQAPAALADTFMPVYNQGWDVVRQARYNNQLAMGVIDSRYPFLPLGGTGPHEAEPIVAIPAWNTLAADRQADLARRMAIYASMVKKVDDNVGKVVSRLRATGQLDNTLIFFFSDNGANLEGGVFGSTPENANASNGPLTGAALTNMGQAGQNDVIHYGGGWAHNSNTPLKLFKHFTHEGGIRAPFIVHWPAGFTAKNVWSEDPVHLIDVMATIKDVTGATYPATYAGHNVLPLEGRTLVPQLAQQAVSERPLFVEHESNRMMRQGRWKLVTENFTSFDKEFTANEKLLYDMNADPGESTDLASTYPAQVVQMVDQWNVWATRVGLPASRLIAPPPLNLTPAATPQDLFVDTFNRQNATDIDSSVAGISATWTPAAGATWFEGWEGSGTADSIQIVDNVLQMATGLGMSENGLNHNFITQDILDAGGFSVSVRVLSINTDTADSTNRYAGFGVGLNATEAAAGNDVASTTPKPIRGLTTNPGCADCFVELDLDGNVKVWTGGVLAVSAPVGKTQGTLTASFQCTSFAAGAPVTVSAWLDGKQIDLDPATAAMTRSFTWNESNANYIALSARGTNFVQVDNFAVRKLPVANALAVDRALALGLNSSDTSPDANPDGDALTNFGEWAFGTDLTKRDDFLASTNIVVAQPASGVFRFSHRRLTGYDGQGVRYRYLVSSDLANWMEISPVEESTAALAASPGYEAVTLRLPDGSTNGAPKLFVKVSAESK